MNNLLELGQNLVKEMKNQYKDSSYRYIDELDTMDTIDTIPKHKVEMVYGNTMEINGLLNLYLELDNSFWDAKEDSTHMENRTTGEIVDTMDMLGTCIDELIQNNPCILKKYGLKQIIPNLHEAKIQEV